MTTRPTHIQTSTEAKKLYKKNGPGLPEWQRRQIERDAALEKRALGLREREERARINRKKREEKQRKEAEHRKMNGVGLATQMAGYSHTQARLKKGMEAFVGWSKKSEDEKRKKEIEVEEKLEAVMDEVAKEPWDDDDSFDIPIPTARAEDPFDNDLDDDTLLEIHDQVVSDPVQEVKELPKPPRVASSAPAAQAPKIGKPSREDIDFLREHGPINKMVESILDKLPEPLVELLSQDCSIDPAFWNPASALLYKLNAPGVPPHRLRLKEGCVVTLLRDLNSSSPLSKSQHLQVLRAGCERLECLVLDGQLEGTKTILTKVAFIATYRNDDELRYRRVQFPIEVSKDYGTPPASRKVPQSGFKKPVPSVQAAQASSCPSRRTLPAPKAPPQMNRNPSFKLPGLPASKSKSESFSKSPAPGSPPGLDGWDDFLDSATQIARDLSSDDAPLPGKVPPQALPTAKPPAAPATPVSHSPPALSAQKSDFSVDDDDLEDAWVLGYYDFPIVFPKQKTTSTTIVPPSKPRTTPTCLDKPMNVGLLQSAKSTLASMMPPQNPCLKRKACESITASTHSPPKMQKPNVPAMRGFGRIPRTAHAKSSTKRMATTTTTAATKPPNLTSKYPSKPPTTAKATPSLSDFGLSTQEAVSFFDDDDDFAHGSPPITV